MCGRCSAAIPIPVSATVRTADSPSPRTTRTSTRVLPARRRRHRVLDEVGQDRLDVPGVALDRARRRPVRSASTRGVGGALREPPTVSRATPAPGRTARRRVGGIQVQARQLPQIADQLAQPGGLVADEPDGLLTATRGRLRCRRRAPWRTRRWRSPGCEARGRHRPGTAAGARRLSARRSVMRLNAPAARPSSSSVHLRPDGRVTRGDGLGAMPPGSRPDDAAGARRALASAPDQPRASAETRHEQRDHQPVRQAAPADPRCSCTSTSPERRRRLDVQPDRAAPGCSRSRRERARSPRSACRAGTGRHPPRDLLQRLRGGVDRLRDRLRLILECALRLGPAPAR